MIKHIKKLAPLPRYLLGKGYDKGLEYINSVIPLEIIEVPSGTDLGNGWVVPDEWIIKDAWVKFNGKKILDFKKDPLCVSDYSIAVHEKMDKKAFREHLNTKDFYMDVDNGGKATPYNYHFYEKKWSFNCPFEQIYAIDGCKDGVCMPELKDYDKEVGKVQIEGETNKYVSLLEEGEYEVFVDSEFKPGTMKIGVHTIPGKKITGTVLDREILLFAHLDHPYQAIDNIAGVSALMDMAKQLKEKGFDHTIKLVFCPETIGSIAYAKVADINKVDFMIALDSVGANSELIIQKSFDEYARINKVINLAVQDTGITFKKGTFRKVMGSDEYYFNDPKVGIHGLMFTHYPYPEYHTSQDTPDKVNIKKLEEVQKVILRVIEIYEKDYIPKREYKGVLFRSKYGAHTPSKLANLDIDYFLWNIDGKKYISEILLDSNGQLMLSFNFCLELLELLKKDNLIT